MKNSYKNLTVIIPVTRGIYCIPSVKSAYAQIGFDSITVIVTGKSTQNNYFINVVTQEFQDNDFRIVPSQHKSVILAGEARNDGLRYIKKNKIDAEFILFLDDDVIIPSEYCIKLSDYMNKNNYSVVHGRMSSIPTNFWTRTIDYSNFWWLQSEEDIKGITWLATAAALTKAEYINETYFEEHLVCNEDIIFLGMISRKTSKPMSVYSGVTCEHHHLRKNLLEFVKYQFNNGKNSILMHNEGVSLIKAFKNIRFNFRSTLSVNKKFFSHNKKILIGALMSFIIFEIGIQSGALLIVLNTKTKLKRTLTRIVTTITTPFLFALSFLRKNMTFQKYFNKIIFVLFSPRKCIRKYRNLKLYKKIEELRELKAQNKAFPNYENELKKSYITLIDEGSTVIDVGAHNGLHLNVFKDLIGKTGTVFAFEPLPKQFLFLVKEYSGYKNIVLVNKALSNEVGISDFFELEGLPEESGLVKRIYSTNILNKKPEKIKVIVDILDSYQDSFLRVDFIKLDTEGSDLNILKGSCGLLKKHRPIVSIEYGNPTYSLYGFTKESLFIFSKTNKYVITDLWGNIIPNIQVWRDVCDSIYRDFFLVPEEKLHFFLQRIKKREETVLS